MQSLEEKDPVSEQVRNQMRAADLNRISENAKSPDKVVSAEQYNDIMNTLGMPGCEPESKVSAQGIFSNKPERSESPIVTDADSKKNKSNTCVIL